MLLDSRPYCDIFIPMHLPGVWTAFSVVKCFVLISDESPGPEVTDTQRAVRRYQASTDYKISQNILVTH